jgi:hypothetical protein
VKQSARHNEMTARNPLERLRDSRQLPTFAVPLISQTVVQFIGAGYVVSRTILGDVPLTYTRKGGLLTGVRSEARHVAFFSFCQDLTGGIPL